MRTINRIALFIALPIFRIPVVVSLGLLLLAGCKDTEYITEYIRIEPIEHTAVHSFSINDVQGGFLGETYVEDPSIICGITDDCPEAAVQPRTFTVDGVGPVAAFPVDSEFGYIVSPFVGAAQKLRDLDYAEGWVANVAHPEYGTGLLVANAVTDVFQSPKNTGSWCIGLGGALVKCSSEHYSVLEHVLTCHESIPYTTSDPSNVNQQNDLADPANGSVIGSCTAEKLSDTLRVLEDGVAGTEYDRDNLAGVLVPNESTVRNDIAVGADYGVTFKDDGKPLYRWGNAVKRPNDVRLYARLPLPDAWKEPNAVYTVRSAELVVRHMITNNPNDQIRPEDMENESATGRLPTYMESGASRLSMVDCFEGDGDFIAAGTILKNGDVTVAGGLSSDLTGGFTNAWYTTTDRDPFAPDEATGIGPRWRLKANKFGQDLPSLEIPLETCSEPPASRDSYRYIVGEFTTTTIDLLNFEEGEDSPLASSLGWIDSANNPVNIVDDDPAAPNGVSINGLPLTEDFDLAVYIKGDAKSTVIYDATLNIVYEEVAP